MVRSLSGLALLIVAATPALAFDGAETAVKLTPFAAKVSDDQIELKNDGFVDEGGQAYLQLGFVTGEKAGIWVQVPNDSAVLKVESFRVLFSDGETIAPKAVDTAYFHMGIASTPTTAIPAEIQNAVSLTSGPYWNDIPAQGANGETLCARAGEFVGAALEFTHDGSPSVFRDLDGLSNPKHNVLMAIPGGWNYSVVYGLRGDWILRVIARKAEAGECGV